MPVGGRSRHFLCIYVIVQISKRNPYEESKLFQPLYDMLRVLDQFYLAAQSMSCPYGYLYSYVRDMSYAINSVSHCLDIGSLSIMHRSKR